MPTRIGFGNFDGGSSGGVGGGGGGSSAGGARVSFPQHDGATSSGVEVVYTEGSPEWSLDSRQRETETAKASLTVQGETSGAELRLKLPRSSGDDDTERNAWRLRTARGADATDAVDGVQASVLVPLGDDAAVISYKAVAERSDDAPFKAWVSSTYVKRDGKWLLAFHQQTLAATGK